jgi:hypothetical protein
MEKIVSNNSNKQFLHFLKNLIFRDICSFFSEITKATVFKFSDLVQKTIVQSLKQDYSKIITLLENNVVFM